MRSTTVRRCRPLLGTFVEVTAVAAPAIADRGIERAFRAIEAVARRMSFHDPASDIGRLNRSTPGRAVVVHKDTWRVLSRALRLSQQTHGTFDVTIGAELVRWGFLPAAAGRAGTFRDLELLPGSRARRHRAVLVDLGGIAKGFAVDQAVRALRRAGVRSGCVNAGGDLRSFGRQAVTVEVRLPHAPAQTRSLARLREGAVATSGGYLRRRRAQGRLRTPLVHGGTREALAATTSVSVFAPSALLADALTKAVLADPDGAAPLLRRHRAHAVLIDRRGTVRVIAS